MELFITKLFEQPAFYISTVASFAGSICVHEYCHAFVAHHLGDDTAKEGGFMTLNPLKVMGWMSIATLLIFGFSWGAVPVKREDPSRLRRSAISLAGPLSNLALLGIVALFLKGGVCCCSICGRWRIHLLLSLVPDMRSLCQCHSVSFQHPSNSSPGRLGHH